MYEYETNELPQRRVRGQSNVECNGLDDNKKIEDNEDNETDSNKPITKKEILDEEIEINGIEEPMELVNGVDDTNEDSQDGNEKFI